MKYKKMMSSLLTFIAMLVISGVALAADEAVAGSGDSVKVALALAAGFGLAIAAAGAAFAQGRAASAFMEGVSRNPNAADNMFVPLILALAFIEALAIYAFLIAIFLQGKI